MRQTSSCFQLWTKGAANHSPLTRVGEQKPFTGSQHRPHLHISTSPHLHPHHSVCRPAKSAAWKRSLAHCPCPWLGPLPLSLAWPVALVLGLARCPCPWLGPLPLSLAWPVALVLGTRADKGETRRPDHAWRFSHSMRCCPDQAGPGETRPSDHAWRFSHSMRCCPDQAGPGETRPSDHAWRFSHSMRCCPDQAGPGETRPSDHAWRFSHSMRCSASRCAMSCLKLGRAVGLGSMHISIRPRHSGSQPLGTRR